MSYHSSQQIYDFFLVHHCLQSPPYWWKPSDPIGAETSISTPRPPLQETQHKPTQIPQEDACYQNQTLTMADLSHIRQQGTLLVDHRGIVLPDARKWTTEYWQQSSTDVITIPGTLLSLSNTQSQVRRVAAESSVPSIFMQGHKMVYIHTIFLL